MSQSKLTQQTYDPSHENKITSQKINKKNNPSQPKLSYQFHDPSKKKNHLKKNKKT